MTNATIFHNPACGTSRSVLAALTEAGLAPTVVPYLKTGWTPDQLRTLCAQLGTGPRAILRLQGTPAKDLGLDQPSVSDEALIAAMVAHPQLVNRPIVVIGTRAALCRPADRVKALMALG
ncbi:MAG: arsenate reductase (glutaredoxin) [Alphaproteobacteria bacterium]|nr:arsenate reductase (glutaredoxin) [Alphaproteobacteria bacterium]